MKIGTTTNVELPISQQMADLLQGYLIESVKKSSGKIEIVISPKGVQIVCTDYNFIPWIA